MVNAEADCIVAVEAEDATVILGTQLGAPHVAHAHQVAVRTCLQNDVFKFRWLDEPSHRAHADLITLIRARRGLADLSGSDLDILLGKRAQNVRCSQAACRHAKRVEPQAHGIFPLAKILYVGDTGNPLERVAHVEIDIVAEKKAAVLAVVGVDARAEDEIA